jgi:hypothetical protein
MSKQDIDVSNEKRIVKGSNRIQINNILGAMCLGVLTVIIGLSKDTLNLWVVSQLAIAIPLLVTSSLAYSKICYRNENEYIVWNNLAWLTHSLGYISILNAIAIFLSKNGYPSSAILFLGGTITLHLVYTIINISMDKSRLLVSSLKLLFYMLLFSVGSIYPILK